jgi:hypothetical protein
LLLAVARFSSSDKERAACAAPTICLTSGRTSGLEVDRRFPPAFLLNFIADLLTFIEARQPRALDGADMDEDVLATIVGLNETKSLCGVEPLLPFL